MYLAAVLDAFSRRVVGWAMQEHLEGSPFWDAVRVKASAEDGGEEEAVCHG